MQLEISGVEQILNLLDFDEDGRQTSLFKRYLTSLGLRRCGSICNDGG